MNLYLREFIKANIVGLLIFIVHGTILYFLGNPWYDGDIVAFFWQNQLFTIWLYAVNSIILFRFRKYFKGNLWTVKLFLYAIVLHTVATLVAIFVLRLLLINLYYNVSFDSYLKNEGPMDYVVPLFITVAATSLFYGVYRWKSKQESKVKQSRIIAGAASAQFDALKNQLDPHFLFNSLNVLASLIEENPVQAQKFTTSLSKVYRYVLEQKSKELVSLDEELAFARTYMKLLKMRFEDSIIVDIPEKASNASFKVVPLSLQLLLENAVKHNIVTPASKLNIIIYEEGNRLFVKNNIQSKQVVKKSSGVGLENIKKRYQLLSNSNLLIDTSNAQFTVGVPILTKTVDAQFTPKQQMILEDKRYQRAKKRVEDLKGFYIHLVIYSVMFPIFIYLNIQSTSFPWALFPIIGWGWGVIGHASETFGWNPIFNKKWEQRKIDRLMDDETF